MLASLQPVISRDGLLQIQDIVKNIQYINNEYEPSPKEEMKGEDTVDNQSNEGEEDDEIVDEPSIADEEEEQE